jgi:hypothetical protein
MLNKKDIESNLRLIEKKKLKTESTHAGFYKINKKGEKTRVVTIIPMLNDLTEAEAIAEITRIFDDSAKDLKVDKSLLKFRLCREYSTVEYERPESDKEFNERIKWMVGNEEWKLRQQIIKEEKQLKDKEKKIAEMESMLIELKKSIK